MTRLSASCVVVVTKMRKGTIELFFQVELVFGFFFFASYMGFPGNAHLKSCP